MITERLFLSRCKRGEYRVDFTKAHEKLTPKNSGEASEKLCRSLKKTVGAA